jgi:DUF4097 and DUF4098 domain-containing protein YvlB
MRLDPRMVLVAAAGLALAGCDDWSFGDSSRFKEDFHYTYDLKPGARLSLENMNGSVEIVGWEKASVDVSGTKYAATEEILKDIKIDAQNSPEALRIRTVPPGGIRGSYGARYVLRVPRELELEKIVSSNGSVRVEDIKGSAHLRTSNGAVKVLRSKGNYEVQTSNGSVELSDPSGSVIARTSNGAIRADGVQGSLDLSTSNGSITAQLAKPEAGRVVKLESSNGSINLSMDSCQNNEVRATTSNSSITVRVPGSCGANLHAHTSNSTVTTDFEVNAREKTKSSLDGTLGSGGPSFDLRTSNGSIKVLKL